MSEATDRLEELAQGLQPKNSARLSFTDLCAAFALVKRGFPQSLVAQVFGVTPAAISKLASAETNPRRYANVAAELQRLGWDEFREKYITNEIIERLQRFRVEAPLTSDLRRGRGPNPAADKSAGAWELTAGNGEIQHLEVFWRDGAGWTWRHLGEGWITQQEPCLTSLKAREQLYASFAAADQERRQP